MKMHFESQLHHHSVTFFLDFLKLVGLFRVHYDISSNVNVFAQW